MYNMEHRRNEASKYHFMKVRKDHTGGISMSERVYKTMSRAGASSLVLGIILMVTGITAGIMMVVNGARLLKRKSDIII